MMDALLGLVRAAIWERPVPEGLTITDWPAVFRLACEHRIDALLLSVALESCTDAEILRAWQERAMITMIRQTQITDELHTVLTRLEESRIRGVVLKGVVLKVLYPEPDMRVMSDADLLVSGESFDAARSALIEYGFALIEDDCHDDTFVCANEAGLRIELHRRLFDRKRQGFLALLDEDKMFPMSKAVCRSAHGGDVWTLPETEHALFLILHMAKHLIVTGFGLRQACDFALFCERHGGAIDWLRLRDECERLNLITFTRALMWICVERLDMPDGPGLSAFGCDAAAGEFLLADMMDAGVFGKSSDERTRSAAVVYRAFDRDAERGSGGRLARLAAAIFIRRDELHPPFMYAKRYAWLLPVAWVHRLILFVFRRDTDARREASEGMRIAGERLALLKQLDMVK